MKRQWCSLLMSILVAAGALFLCLTWEAWGAAARIGSSAPPDPLDTVSLSPRLAWAASVEGGTEVAQEEASTAPGNWVIDCVDCPLSVAWIEVQTNTVGTSLVVDPEGYAHVALYLNPEGDDKTDLYYGFQDATGWHLEKLRSNLGVWGSSVSVSLALDEDGTPHIGFASHYGDGAWYTYRDGSGAWHFESVDERGFRPSLALDGDGDPHMSYQENATTLTYAYRDGGEWHAEPVLAFSYFAGEYTAISVDGDGHPHIAGNGDVAGDGVFQPDLWYATFDGTKWLTATVDTSVYSRFALEVGADGYADIVYRHAEEKDLRHAYEDVSGWHTQTVDSEDDVGWYPSLTLGSGGDAHAAYYDSDKDDLRYAYLDGSGWHTQTLDSEGDVGSYTALDVDDDEYPHVIYYDATNEEIKYTYQDHSGWQSAPQGRVGMHTSVALDDSGYKHVSYYDWSGGDLKYAYRDASGWYRDAVDSVGDVGLYTSLAIAGSGYPRISYYDVTNGDLRFAYQDASGWHSQTVDSVDDVGQYTSLALEPTAPYTPHISYYDATNEHPKYAFLGAAGWHSQTVGTAVPAGQHTSLVLGSDGYPRISYYCHSSGDLRYTHQVSPTGWTESVVAYYTEDWNKVGRFSFLALDSSGSPYISYYDEVLGALRVASGWAPFGWSTMWTVDSVPAWDTSLVMSGTHPHISYYDAFHGTLKYAYRDGSGWQKQTVDSDGIVGRYTSLALDADGVPHISYHDVNKSNLKVAYTSDLPVAGFMASPTSGVSPLTVVFTDTSTGGEIDTWLWSFGDGVTSSLQSPTHTYTAAGAYTVTLAVSGPGGSDAISQTDYVTVYAPAQAAFTAAPMSGPVPLEVAFTNTSSGDHDTSLWAFGDGLTSTLERPTHTYTAAGTYTVTLTVDGLGGTDTISRSDYITGYTPVRAGFNATPTIGYAPLTVTFTNTSTGDYDTSLWAFGDDSTSSSERPTHTYMAMGTYGVTLTVSGPGGTSSVSRPDYVTVHARPEVLTATFSADVVSGTAPLEVTFTAVTSGTVEHWLWSFGDGATASTGPVVGHTYVASDTFGVELTVSNTHGSFVVSKPHYIAVRTEEEASGFVYLPVVLRMSP